ncbi:cuticle protein AM1199-like [Panulirus ornatus]|uniref:cuticle protein AM1199-like n=1 Tax=Panulirus ornatus TaxID=150431 RepID=UPI003A85BE79
MKLVLLACLAAVAVAGPQFRQANPRQYAVLRDDRVDEGNGNFQYEFETENGIQQSAVGRPGSAGQSNIQGSYRFTLPDGTLAEVRFIADENGFRAESPLIPTPHPLPAHAIEQVRFAESERARAGTRRQF